MEGLHPLKAFRIQRSLSLADSARMLDVPKSLLWRWEERKRPVGRESLRKVSERTGIPAAELRPDLAELFSGDAQ